MLNNFKNLDLKDKIGIILFLSSFIFIGVLIWAAFKTSIWNDEAFSLLLAQQSYYNIIATTATDVHPPLYYFVLKFVVSLFQFFNLTTDSTIVIAKFLSIVPIILLLTLSFFKVRRNWGWLCCGVFAVCLTSMPQLMHFSVEIRMYSWALFFVTVCFIYAYEVIRDSNIKNWIIMTLSGVCAAYTHYFAAVSVIFIFLLLLTYFVINNKTEIKKWLIAVIMSFALYLFWLFILINQLIKVTHHFWIDPLTLDKIWGFLWFIVSPSKIFYPTIEIMGVLLTISYLIVFIHYFIKSDVNWKSYENFILLGFFVLFLTVILGIIVSVLIKPLFLDRYVVPSLGVFWLTFAFLLSKSWDYKKIFVPVLCVVLIVSCMSTITFFDSEVFAQDVYNDLDSFLKQDSIKNDVLIIDVDNEDYVMTEVYTIKYLLKNYHNMNLTINYSSDVYKALNDNKTVWLFSSENYTLILQNCTKQNLTIQKYAQYRVAKNWTYDINNISQI